VRKRIDFLAPPFSGHLHPMLAMARSLGTQYDVRVVSSLSAQAAIKTAGLHGVVLNGIDDQQLLSIVNPPYAVGSNPIKLHRQFKQVLRLLQCVYDELEILYRHDKPDLFIIDFTLPVGGTLASKMGITWWTSLPSPCILESSEGPPAYLGGLKEAANPYQSVRNAIARKLVRVFKTLVFGFYRKEINTVGLNNVYRADGSEAIYSQDKILCLVLQQLEFHKNWPACAEFLGPMLYTPPVKCQEPEFLEGRIHVLITLGTHLHWRKDAVAEEVLTLAKKLPELVFHFSDGNTVSLKHGDSKAENFKRFNYINYDKHLHRYDYVIHHGGAGIMYQCLRSAIPAIVYPIDYDQFDHAARLSETGVAIWIRQLSHVEQALLQLINANSIKDKCEQFEETMVAEQPKERFATLVNAHFKRIN